MPELSLIAILITTTASAVVAIIAQVQHSRCVTIKLCCGLFECSRNVPDVVDPESHPQEPIPPPEPIVS